MFWLRAVSTEAALSVLIGSHKRKFVFLRKKFARMKVLPILAPSNNSKHTEL